MLRFELLWESKVQVFSPVDPGYGKMLAGMEPRFARAFAQHFHSSVKDS